MPTRQYDTPEGELTLWTSWWNGKETVRHQTGVVSEEQNLGLLSHHRFLLPGVGPEAAVQYELRYGMFWGWSLKRNGVPIDRGRSGLLLSWALGFGILMVALQLAAPAVESVWVRLPAAPPVPWPVDVSEMALPLAFAGGFPFAWWMRKKSRDKLER
jgi:hypothetical protein